MTKKQKQILHNLWAECVKAKAGYKSEISGREGRQIGGEYVLHAHHIKGKACNRLRYEIDNGVCLTAGEHKFGVHVQGRADDYNRRIEECKGKKIMDKLSILRHQTMRADYFLIKTMLEGQLEDIKNERQGIQERLSLG